MCLLYFIHFWQKEDSTKENAGPKVPDDDDETNRGERDFLFVLFVVSSSLSQTYGPQSITPFLQNV